MRLGDKKTVAPMWVVFLLFLLTHCDRSLRGALWKEAHGKDRGRPPAHCQ